MRAARDAQPARIKMESNLLLALATVSSGSYVSNPEFLVSPRRWTSLAIYNRR